ncbi:MAG: urea ABC transporter permease subunit UrtB [Pseudomonadota bacterium]
MNLPRLVRAVLCVAVLWLAAPAAAQDLRALVDDLGGDDFAETAAAVEALGRTGDPAAAPVLEALANGDLYVLRADGAVVRGERDGREVRIADVFTGADLGTVGRRDASAIRVNNRLRRTIDAALGGLTLLSPDAAVRAQAAASVFQSRDLAALPTLEQAIAEEVDARVREAMVEARAAIVAFGDGQVDARLEAIATIAARTDRQALSTLLELSRSAPDDLADAAALGAAEIERRLQRLAFVQNVVFGISLGSVLLLAAIGLAITFGVMGVINMAHGEMVMIGAYTTYVVQEIIRNHAPWLFGGSLFIALPLAFLTAGAIGVLIERGIIRFLYGRPLETLLATWGLSLILQQLVRTLFGASNREVGTPDWMSGSVEFLGLSLATNRVAIIVFALLVFAALLLLLRHTSFGLHVRAVTQNRAMASSMGIRTGWVDAFTFGLGSGIAGLAGVAISQIDNVSPNLGQGYIIDSFLVVVFGGVGNLWGTLVAAMSVGVANKLMEPVAGAVLAKIMVLVFVILFIQKRPRGLFALRGRAVET